MAKTLKTKGFTIESRNRYGKVVFKVSEKKYSNYKRFRIRATPKGEGKRIDKEFETIECCYAFVEEFERNNPINEDEWRTTRTSLTPDELNDAQIALKLLPKGVTLCEAVNQFKLKNETKEIRVCEAWEEYRKIKIRTKENRDGKWRSKKTVDEKDFFFKPIISRVGNRRVKDLTPGEMPQFWQNKNWGDQSRLNRFKALKAFFSWCMIKNYHFENIMLDQLTPVITRNTLPRVFTLNEVEKLLVASTLPRFRKIKSFVALSIFGGLRASEIHDDWNPKTCLNWSHFTLEPKGNAFDEVNIPFIGKKKVNDNRRLPPKLVKILIEEREAGFDVVPEKNGINLWRHLRKHCGVSDAPSNTPRHTAISFFYRHNPFTGKQENNFNVLEDQFGNSQDVQERHYKNSSIATEDAVKFWVN